MDIFCASSLTAKNLRKLQRCRLYLQAIRLSDIANEDGLKLHECINIGKRPPRYSPNYIFPCQKRPPKKDFTLLWTTLINEDIIYEDGTLVKPLGGWIHRDSIWKYY